MVTWEHPERKGNAALNVPCKVVWYHGTEGMKRRAEVLQPMVGNDTEINKWGIGVAFIGDKGVLVTDYGKHVLSPSVDFKDYERPEQTIAKSKGHYNEWLAACKGRDKTATLCNFDYSGKLIEHNLLGVAAHRYGGGKLNWGQQQIPIRSSVGEPIPHQDLS